MKYILFIFIYLYMFIFPYECASDETGIFYIRLDNKVRNGIMVDTSLLMIPAQDEFRITSFKKYTITGMTSDNSTQDALTDAKHEALKNLLLNVGVKSVKNVSITDKINHNEETVLSYEGYIKTPYIILNQRYVNEKQRYEVNIEIYFSQMAYPDEWNMKYFKKKIYDLFHNMISVFF